MPIIDLRLSGDDGAFKDLADKEIINAGESFRLSYLTGGMQSGKDSLAFAVRLPEAEPETWVFFETSVELFLATANAIKARSERDT